MLINLLEQVLPIINNVIDPMTGVFQFRTLVGQEINEIGIPVPTYGPWYTCHGTVQPVNRSRYEALGLDWSKNYINAWGSVMMHTVGEHEQPDQILWRDRLWLVTAVTEWKPHNGWVNVTAVEDKRSEGDEA